MLQPVVRAKAPKAKPEHTEFGLTCKLCGTRVYARPEQVGKQIKCPDCHSAVDVTAPPRPKVQPKAPSLDDVEEVALDDPGERPRYRPMVRPQGEDAVLGLLNDPPFDVRTGQPRTGGAPGSSPNAAAADFPEVGKDPTTAANRQRTQPQEAAGFAGQGSTADEEEDDFELRLSDPVERPAVKVELPHHIAADLPDPRDEGSYGDELWGSGSSGTRPRWQQSPFLVGVLEFLFQQSTLGSWIGYGLSAGVLLCMLQLAMQFSRSSGPEQVAGLLVSICFTVLAISWSATFGSACLAVIQDTANGNETVEDWPDWHFFDWFVRSFTLVVAVFVAAFPGLLVGSAMLTSGAPLIAIPLPVLASLVAFAPIVLTSILVEGSVLNVVSPTVLRMVRTAAEGWILFYMLTFVIGMLAVGALALLEIQNLITSFIAGALCVTLALLYCRLLGRLMWYSQHKLTEEDAREENRRRWAERAMHP